MSRPQRDGLAFNDQNVDRHHGVLSGGNSHFERLPGTFTAARLLGRAAIDHVFGELRVEDLVTRFVERFNRATPELRVLLGCGNCYNTSADRRLGG